MKKLLLLGAALLVAQSVSAQMTESYYYRMGEHPTQVMTAPPQPVYAAPASPQAYSFYRNPNTYYAPGAQAARQQAYYAAANPSYGRPMYNQNSYYRSPVYNQQAVARKLFYAGAHVGVGTSLGWPNGLNDLVVPVGGLTIGTYLDDNVRADAEFLYHGEGKLAKLNNGEVKYKQYNLGANIYYDINTGSLMKPFIGAGVWGVQGKTSAKLNERSSLMSGVKLGLSISAGITRPITDEFTFVAMARARYIFSKEGIYNLEGLFGVQYHF